MSTAHVPGGCLYYEVAGAGRPVLLLHGGALDLRMWDQQMDALTAEYQVVRFDARGHGRSSTPTAPFRQCDDIATLIAELALSQVTLVGLSMGGGAAVDTALEHPSVVEALVVCGAGTNEPYFEDPWTLEQQRRQLEAQRAGDPAAWVESYLTAYLAGPYRPLASVDPAIVKRCRDMALNTVRTHVKPGALAPEHVENSWARLGEIDVPLLGVVGELDSPDHRAMVNRLAAGVPGAQTAVIEGTAHYPNMEQADVFNRTLLSFLKRPTATGDRRVVSGRDR